MLSYMLPVDERSTSPRNLSLNLNINNTNNNQNDVISEEIDENTKLLNNERDSVNNCNLKDNSGTDDSRKVKMGKIGNNKNVALKRVSFGSSKGSMVETLVFETPTPLPEHAEREFTFDNSENQINGKTTIGSLNNDSNLEDSGIGLQEEVERSKVRVSFFQSSKPQLISPPDTQLSFFGDNNNSILIDSSFLSETASIDENMATTTITQSYDRQISTESGWDNPFRPGGDLSREADEIVNLIKGGKPITPTGEPNLTILNGDVQIITENGTSVVDGAIKSEVSQLQSTPQNGTNGTKSPQKPTIDKASTNGDTKSQPQISNQVLPTPQSASHVILEDKKKKKSCCVIQ